MIKIDDEYLINANESCYTLERKTKIKDSNSKNYGKEVNEIEGYYTSIDGALNGYLKVKMRKYVSKEKENTIQEAIKELEEALLKVKDKNIKLFMHYKNSIPVQKVKDKIEELNNNKPYLAKFKDWKEKEYTNEDIIRNCIEVLEELLEDK